MLEQIAIRIRDTVPQAGEAAQKERPVGSTEEEVRQSGCVCIRVERRQVIIFVGAHVLQVPQIDGGPIHRGEAGGTGAEVSFSNQKISERK